MECSPRVVDISPRVEWGTSHQPVELLRVCHKIYLVICHKVKVTRQCHLLFKTNSTKALLTCKVWQVLYQIQRAKQALIHHSNSILEAHHKGASFNKVHLKESHRVFLSNKVSHHPKLKVSPKVWVHHLVSLHNISRGQMKLN